MAVATGVALWSRAPSEAAAPARRSSPRPVGAARLLDSPPCPPAVAAVDPARSRRWRWRHRLPRFCPCARAGPAVGRAAAGRAAWRPAASRWPSGGANALAVEREGRPASAKSKQRKSRRRRGRTNYVPPAISSCAPSAFAACATSRATRRAPNAHPFARPHARSAIESLDPLAGPRLSGSECAGIWC